MGAAIRDRRPGEGEVRIQRDGVLEHLEGEIHVPRRAPAGVAAPAEIEVVRLEVLRRLGGELRLFLGGQLDPQRLGDLVRDLVLNGEDVGHLPVITLRPDGEAGRRVDELRVDPQPVPGAPQAALEGEVRPQLPADVRGRGLLVAEREDGGARKDVQTLDLREVRQDVLGDAVAQVLVFLHAREVLEVEDGDRPLRARRRHLRVGGRSRAGPVVPRACGAAAADRSSVRSPSGSGGPVLLQRLLQNRAERRRASRGSRSSRGRGSRFRIASKTTACVSPSKARSPVAIW